MAKRSKEPRKIPLSEACLHFASPAMKRALRQLEVTPIEIPAVAISQDDAQQVRSIIELIGSGLNHFTRKIPVYHEMQEHLMRRVYNGKLTAWGIRTKPVQCIEHELIPAMLFFEFRDIKISKNTIEVAGQKFESVYFCSSHAIQKLNEQAANHTIPKAKIGRPPVIGEILECIEILKSDNLTSNVSVKELETRVRKKCRSLYPSSFPRETQPSKTKIYEALRAAGLMIAKSP